ncbi:MAG: Arsenic efflux pump protein [Myxococcaceae bacterium]|nr:Arsenic efflux pump protein [Myxococcaceae bacterium]
MWKGLLVFGVTYALVARIRWLKIDRPGGALVGAVLAVVLGASSPSEASAAVDKSTLILLFAVMGMGAFLSIDGFFERATTRLASVARTRARLLGAIVWGSGLFAAFVTNDAVCVLAAPVVVELVRRWKLPRLPFLMALATGANTGSVATLVGNPQNMLCASLGRLDFASFVLHMAPVAILGLAVNHALLAWLYRADLHGDLTEPTDDSELPALATGPLLTGPTILTLVVIAISVVAYTAGGNLAFTALTGFALLLLLHRGSPTRVWERIDWSILLFFGGLFIAVDALARSGAAAWVFERAALFQGPPGLVSYTRTAMYFLLGSNVVTNVPFILIVKSEMGRMPNPTLAWELLAMASTFAGNLTLLGSIANVIVAEKARDVGGLGFKEYLRAGVPIAVATTLLGTLWLVVVRGLL